MTTVEAQREIGEVLAIIKAERKRLRAVAAKLKRAAKTAPVVDEDDGDQLTAERWLAESVEESTSDGSYLSEAIRQLTLDCRMDSSARIREYCRRERQGRAKRAARIDAAT